VPDARAGEAVDHRHAELLRGPRRLLHLFDRPLVDAVGLAVAPDMGGQDRLVALVDPIADGLADEVARDRVDGEVIPLERIALRGAVAALLERPSDVEVVAPAGQLETLVAELLRLAGEILERQVGPLAGEQRDGTGHGKSSGVRDDRWAEIVADFGGGENRVP
jgi:hypothetical protein